VRDFIARFETERLGAGATRSTRTHAAAVAAKKAPARARKRAKQAA
jgi:hypothetical protein